MDTNNSIVVSRKEIAVHDNNAEMETLLAGTVLYCFQSLGETANENDVIFIAKEILAACKQHYSIFTIEEICDIIKDGYKFRGNTLKKVSLTNCCSLIKEYYDEQENRVKLEKKREQPKVEYQMPVNYKKDYYDALKDFDRKKDDLMCFAGAYYYVKNCLRDESIKDNGKEIYAECVQQYEDLMRADNTNHKVSIYQTVCRIMGKEEAIKSIFHTQLFKNWVNNGHYNKFR